MRNEARHLPSIPFTRVRRVRDVRTLAASAALIAIALAGAHASRASDAAAGSMSIDILPGETRNIVDPLNGDTLPVAVLGSPTLDVLTIDPLSVRLHRTAPVKSDEGATHRIEDVNADGLPDLIVWFSARELRLADHETSVRSEALTRGGARLEGSGAVLTLAAALRGHAAARSMDPETSRSTPCGSMDGPSRSVRTVRSRPTRTPTATVAKTSW